jgi:hypothetical protein
LIAILTRRFAVDDYIVGSTVASAFMLVNVFHAGIDVFLGYPIVLLNCAILLATNRLVIHRNHAAAIGLLAILTLLAARFSATPLNAILAQIVGITLMSVYYFSVLSTSGLTVQRWMDLYARYAFALALLGLADFVVRKYLLHQGDVRLTAFFAEPSLYVYTTLPALGYFVNCWVEQRRYGAETLIFILTYLLADSSLGFAGFMLILAFTFMPRMKFWQQIFGLVIGTAVVLGLYVASINLQIRVNDTAAAIANSDLTGSNASTYAFLSNAYVTWRAFLAHPFWGVGIGGYQYVYPTYIVEINGIDPQLFSINLNMQDANSLFFRVAAELGGLGLAVLITFLVVCALVKGQPYVTIRNALLPYMLVRMARYGSYFSLELFFFVGLYIFNYLESRAKAPAPGSAPMRREQPTSRGPEFRRFPVS